MSQLFKWRGGKYHIASKIVPYLPPAQLYYEGFAGGASLFWEKPPHPVEVLNDLDGEVINFYRVLQNPIKRQALHERVSFTLYSREEFRKALSLRNDGAATDVDKAWGFFVRQNQSFAGTADSEGNWGRVFTGSEQKGPSDLVAWGIKKSSLEIWGKRLERVQIDSTDALKGIAYWDSDDTLMYLDPPYAPETWKVERRPYTDVCDADFHRRMVELLLKVKGKVVLSGYDSDLYRPLEQDGWQKVMLTTVSMGVSRNRQTQNRQTGSVKKNHARVECLWIKGGKERRLFGGFSGEGR